MDSLSKTPNDNRPKMKIALISPKADSLSRNPAFREFWTTSEYMKSYRENWTGIGPGLLAIAALTPPDYEIVVIDENFLEIDFTIEYDLVGITAMTQQITRAYEIADEFKRRNVKVVIGGIHATLLSEEAKHHADSVVIGEAEYLWPELLDDFRANRLNPFYRSEKAIDLKDAPLPRYDLIQSYDYKIAWLQTSRGCPRDCEFCSASRVYGRKYRTKTVQQVVDEIKHIKRIRRNATIGFSDDNLLVNKKYSRSLLEALIPLKIRFYAQSDISIADNEELLHLLRRSGCINIFIGFESISEAGLKNIDSRGWKHRQLKNYPAAIEKIQSYGIGVMGAFMVGLDSDDSSVFEKTSSFIIDNKLYEAQITISTPLPHTRLRERLEKENRLLPVKWEDYTLCDVTFIHPTLSKEELENGLLEIYKRINTDEVYEKKIQHFTEIYKDLQKRGLKLWGKGSEQGI
ncbi:MAG: B12-binding domain-containing radical SAM protein [Proteobacteria bacterium]|nr:B12-binding domain-containing radical SAM protein [Pseudomonadota bacterium]